MQFWFQQIATHAHHIPSDGVAVRNTQSGDPSNEFLAVLLGGETSSFMLNCIEPELWSNNASLMDFFFSVLDCERDERRWYAMRYLVEHCGWIFPFRRVALVCDRPATLHFDSHNRIHAEDGPAIAYEDGFCVYARHGVRVARSRS